MIEIKAEKRESKIILRVTGQIDASSSIHLDNQLKNAIEEFKKIIIDLQELEYISSAGLGVFIYYLDEIKEKNIKLVLFGLSDKVYQVFEILGLHELLKLFNK